MIKIKIILSTIVLSCISIVSKIFVAAESLPYIIDGNEPKMETKYGIPNNMGTLGDLKIKNILLFIVLPLVIIIIIVFGIWIYIKKHKKK